MTTIGWIRPGVMTWISCLAGAGAGFRAISGSTAKTVRMAGWCMAGSTRAGMRTGLARLQRSTMARAPAVAHCAAGNRVAMPPAFGTEVIRVVAYHAAAFRAEAFRIVVVVAYRGAAFQVAAVSRTAGVAHPVVAVARMSARVAEVA